MRALVCSAYGDVSDLQLGTLPDPPAPGPGEVLIHVEAAGLNFPDVLIVQGKYQFRPEPPFAPGGECAGTVAAVGDGVERVRVGDRVVATTIWGAFAEQLVVPATNVHPMPEGMAFDVAAGISITYATSYYALKQRAGLQAGETLLVLGAAGGVGMATVELGKAMGAKVIAAASSAEKLDAAEKAGADLRIDYSRESLKQRAKELTEGKGVDVVYDPVGGDLSEQAFRTMAWDGRHLVIGFAAGSIPAIPLNLALLKSASIVGVFWGTWTQRDPAAAAANQEELRAMFEDGRLAPRVTTLPLDDFAEGYALLTGRQVIGKVVFTL